MKLLKKFFNFWNIVRISAFIILAIVLIYPFSSMLKESFISGETGSFTLANYFEFFKYPYYYKTLLNTELVKNLENKYGKHFSKKTTLA